MHRAGLLMDRLDSSVVTELKIFGIALRDVWRLTDEQLGDIHDYLSKSDLLYGAHVPRLADGVDRGVACYPLETAVNCPHLVTVALGLVPIVEAYFEQEPVLYSVNAFWTFPGGEVRPDIHDWHRDTDDEKQLAVFFFLTDVFTSDSAHWYQMGSHLKGKRRKDRLNQGVNGEAGFYFLEDPYGYHYGGRPQSGRGRLMAWARFGVSDPPIGYVNDKNYPVKYHRVLSTKDARVCRLLIRA